MVNSGHDLRHLCSLNDFAIFVPDRPYSPQSTKSRGRGPHRYIPIAPEKRLEQVGQKGVFIYLLILCLERNGRGLWSRPGCGVVPLDRRYNLSGSLQDWDGALGGKVQLPRNNRDW